MVILNQEGYYRKPLENSRVTILTRINIRVGLQKDVGEAKLTQDLLYTY